MEELRKKIIGSCNESGLSVEALYFVLKDVYRDVESAFMTYQYKTTIEKKEGEEK